MMPKFPETCANTTLECALTMIIESIAMEESALSRIMNTESEKLQYVLSNKEAFSIEDILAVNKSVKALLDTIASNQIILKNKMECALEALDNIKINKPQKNKM